MLLSKEQITRYMRHIIIPEISGQGQRKILDSTVVFICEDVAQATLALYYLAASGVGHIYCQFNDNTGYQEILDNVKDLNSDVKISLLSEAAYEGTENSVLSRVIIGSSQYIHGILRDQAAQIPHVGYAPTIIAAYGAWKGIVHTCASESEYESFMALALKYWNDDVYKDTTNYQLNLSLYFSSLMAVIEHLKLCLSLGKPLASALHYNLETMEFNIIDAASDISESWTSVLAPCKKMKNLADARVLIVGCGGLGSPVAFALTASGVGTIGLVDYDIVEISNLNRQIMHSTSRLGMPKVQSAETFLRNINPNIKLNKYNTLLDKDNVSDIISGYDVVVGGLDNLPARYVLNDACYSLKKPLIEAGALDISGLATTIIPGEGHCYRCIFPESADNSLVPSCSETGVLGPVPGVMGIIEAAEAIKYLTHIGESLKNKILLFDVFDTDIYVVGSIRNKHCELCGDR
ncbi:MAG: HesA/MoeB/ThiF family protein [Caulobacteraceae bacterium]